MFNKKTVFVTFILSLGVMALVLLAASIPVGSYVGTQPVAAADVIHTSNYKVAGENTDHIIFQLEPSPTPQTVETLAPEPTQIVVTVVPTIDPSDPAQNPAAPGGVLSTVVSVLAGVIIGALTMLIAALKFFSQLKDNKSAENTIEQLINALQRSFPALDPLKGLINQTGGAMQDAGQVLKDVSDGKLE